jgi:hypothetical protein
MKEPSSASTANNAPSGPSPASPCIGPIKKKRLLKRFGSLKRVQEATDIELLEVDGITKKDNAQVFCITCLFLHLFPGFFERGLIKTGNFFLTEKSFNFLARTLLFCRHAHKRL